MSLTRALSNLSGGLQRRLLAIVVLPLVAAGGYLFAPASAAAFLAVTGVATVVLFETLARRTDVVRAGTSQRRFLAAAVVANGLALTLVGVAVLRAGNGSWQAILVGGGVGVLIALVIIGLTRLADNRPQLALAVLVGLLVVAVIAALVGVGHLLGVATAGGQATLAGGGFLGLLLSYALFIARDVS